MAESSQVHKTVLVVCTGNSCRSPMAAGWLNRHFAGTGWRAESAGVAAWGGSSASPAAIEVMREVGIDLTAHRSRALTPAMVEKADVVLAMTNGHLRELARRFPEAKSKMFLVKSFGLGEAQDVADPIGLSLDVYRHVRDEMIQALGEFLLHLAERGEWNRRAGI